MSLNKLQIYSKNLRNDPRLFILAVMSRVYNTLLSPFIRKSLNTAISSKELAEIVQHAYLKRTDISDHLTTLFSEGLAASPNLIVELGVRGGESTFVFERVAQLTKAKLISVDIEDCSGSSNYKDWIFQQQDDITFAKIFESWCKERDIQPAIDMLFIDTSHLYDHTVQEIESWFPHLAPKAKVIFHDTNQRQIFFRKDGSMAATWDNKRGVIAALEHYFQQQFNERQDFVDFCNNWLIRHYAYSSGLTILQKIQLES